LFHFEVLRHIH